MQTFAEGSAAAKGWETLLQPAFFPEYKQQIQWKKYCYCRRLLELSFIEHLLLSHLLKEMLCVEQPDIVLPLCVEN